MSNAVIYVRVSTKEQTKNYSLASQEQACRDYCERSGYAVVKVFREEGESAKTADRTELGKMLDYCTTKKNHINYWAYPGFVDGLVVGSGGASYLTLLELHR